MKIPKSVKKCARQAQKLTRRFGPAVGQAAMDKCLGKAGALNGYSRRGRKGRKSRKGRR